jgi:hypothetical protein
MSETADDPSSDRRPELVCLFGIIALTGLSVTDRIRIQAIV